MFKSKYGPWFNSERALILASLPSSIPVVGFALLFLSAPGWFDWPMLFAWLWPVYISGSEFVTEYVEPVNHGAVFVFGLFWPLCFMFTTAIILYCTFWLAHTLSLNIAAPPRSG